MPAFGNITVKKKDGTTDVVYTGINASGGDGRNAVWSNKTVGNSSRTRPELRVLTRDSENGAQRFVRGTFQWPQIATDSTTGLVSVVNTALASVSWNIPKGMPDADRGEFAYQFANLIAAAMLKSTVDEGAAP